MLGRPSLWLLGTLGVAVRGGILLLLALIVVVPSTVELRLLLGTNLGSTGFTPEFVALAAAAAALGGVLLVAALAAGAWVELASYESLVNDRETAEQRRAVEPRRLTTHDRRLLWLGLLAVYIGGVIALVIAVLPLVSGAIALTYQEILRPGVGGTIYMRVLSGLQQPLLLLLTSLLLVEVATAVAGRRLMSRRFGLARRDTLGRSAWSTVLGMLATTLLAWLISLALILPLLAGMLAAWDAVRSAYLAPGATADLQAVVGLGVVTIALAAVWCVGLLLAGVASALRAGLWSVESLR